MNLPNPWTHQLMHTYIQFLDESNDKKKLNEEMMTL